VNRLTSPFGSLDKIRACELEAIPRRRNRARRALRDDNRLLTLRMARPVIGRPTPQPMASAQGARR
jgi:hypothetical protein